MVFFSHIIFFFHFILLNLWILLRYVICLGRCFPSQDCLLFSSNFLFSTLHLVFRSPPNFCYEILQRKKCWRADKLLKYCHLCVPPTHKTYTFTKSSENTLQALQHAFSNEDIFPHNHNTTITPRKINNNPTIRSNVKFTFTISYTCRINSLPY